MHIHEIVMTPILSVTYCIAPYFRRKIFCEQTILQGSKFHRSNNMSEHSDTNMQPLHKRCTSPLAMAAAQTWYRSNQFCRAYNFHALGQIHEDYRRIGSISTLGGLACTGMILVLIITTVCSSWSKLLSEQVSVFIQAP